MFGQPSSDRGGLVGGVVVEHDVNVEVWGDFGIDLGEELLELHRAVGEVDGRDHGAIGDVLLCYSIASVRCPQTGRAMAGIVLCALLRRARHRWERRLGPRRYLHLTLLIHTQHDCGLGRSQVETYDVIYLLGEQWNNGELEPALQMGLETKDPPTRGLAHPGALCHLRSRPVKGVVQSGLQGRYYHVLHLLENHRGRPPRARLIDQPIRLTDLEPGASLAHRRQRDPHTLGHVRGGSTNGALQHDARPQRQRLR